MACPWNTHICSCLLASVLLTRVARTCDFRTVLERDAFALALSIRLPLSLCPSLSLSRACTPLSIHTCVGIFPHSTAQCLTMPPHSHASVSPCSCPRCDWGTDANGGQMGSGNGGGDSGGGNPAGQPTGFCDIKSDCTPLTEQKCTAAKACTFEKAAAQGEKGQPRDTKSIY